MVFGEEKNVSLYSASEILRNLRLCRIVSALARFSLSRLNISDGIEKFLLDSAVDHLVSDKKQSSPVVSSIVEAARERERLKFLQESSSCTSTVAATELFPFLGLFHFHRLSAKT